MAELRAKVKYTKVEPSSSCNDTYAELDIHNDNPGFSKYQIHDGETNGHKYYCGGNSTLALGSLQMANTKVSLLFFSKENIKYLQKKIRKVILRRTNGKIALYCDQDEMDLLANMRYIFINHGKNLPKEILQQVLELNDILIESIVPDMITNAVHKKTYLTDISSPIIPIALPINVNRKGRKTLESIMR